MGRDTALLFHDPVTRRGWVVSSTTRPHFTPGKDPATFLQEAGWASGPVWTVGKSRPTHRDSIPERPALSSVATLTELLGPLISHPIVPKLRIYETFLHFPIRLHVLHSTHGTYFLFPLTYNFWSLLNFCDIFGLQHARWVLGSGLTMKEDLNVTGIRSMEYQAR